MEALKFLSDLKHKMAKKSISISLFILLGLNFAYGQPANSPWPMFRHDPRHTGVSPYDGPDVPAVVWTFSAGSWIQSSAAIGPDGTIYVGSSDSHVYAINPDGSLKWSFPTNSYVDSSPAVGKDGTVYVASIDSNLYAIHADGTLKWLFETGSDISSSPVIGMDGTIYISSGDKNIYAVNPDGSLKWSFATGDRIGSSPAIGNDGTIYVGSSDGKLYAITPNGTQKWAIAFGDAIFSSPAVGLDGTVYVGSDDDQLYAVTPDGQIKWSFLTGGNITSSPAIGADGTIYVGSFDHNLYALRPNGTLKWTFTTDGMIWGSSPAIDAYGTVYFGSFDHKLYAVYPDGRRKWEFTTDGEIFASPAIGDDGTLYIGSKDGKLYAIRKASTLLSGSFVIAAWYVGDRRSFQKLLDEMQAIRLTTVILHSIGIVKISGDTIRTVPAEAIGWMLDDAASRGLDVYVGLYNNEMQVPDFEYWREPLKTPIIHHSVEAVREIETLYGSHSALKGYYIPQEANVGIHVLEAEKNGINPFFTELISQVHAVARNRKVIAGGYMEQKSVSLAQLSDWVSAFKSNGLDIFLLQDGVGSFDNSMTANPTIYNYFVAAREAVSPKPLWAVVELFQWSSEGETTKQDPPSPDDNWLHPANAIRVNQQIYFANEAGAAEKIAWINQRHMSAEARDSYLAFGQETEHLYRGYKALYFTGTYYDSPTYTYDPSPSARYPDKGGMLFDNLEGQFSRSEWVGFEQMENAKTIITVDLASIKPVSDVTAVVRTETSSTIFYPKSMRVLVSLDNRNYSELGSMTNPYQDRKTYSKAYLWVSAPSSRQARYVKIEFVHGGETLLVSELEVYGGADRPTAVHEQTDSQPGTYRLMQNYPNPFNPSTTIKYAIPRESTVRLTIYTLLGQPVWEVENKDQPAGMYTVTWDGRDSGGSPLASGIYLLQMHSGSFVATRKLILMK